jgi:hypothetical protein
MSVSYIEAISNNSAHDYWMWVADVNNLGILYSRDSGAELGRFDNGTVLKLAAGTHYTCVWAGVPWYHADKHYRAISRKPDRDYREAVLMWQSQKFGRDGIYMLSGKTMKEFGGYQFDVNHLGKRDYALFLDPPPSDTGPDEISLSLRNADDTLARIVQIIGGIAEDMAKDAWKIYVGSALAANGKSVTGEDVKGLTRGGG